MAEVALLVLVDKLREGIPKETLEELEDVAGPTGGIPMLKLEVLEGWTGWITALKEDGIGKRALRLELMEGNPSGGAKLLLEGFTDGTTTEDGFKSGSMLEGTCEGMTKEEELPTTGTDKLGEVASIGVEEGAITSPRVGIALKLKLLERVGAGAITFGTVLELEG